ncbi:MAG: hypothetical protein ACXW3R_12725, partial [Rhodoplanes sp.]
PSAADQSRITPPRPKTESHRRKRANRESNRRTKRHPQCQIAIPQQPHEIKEYFKQVKPSRTEILSLLSELGVSVSSEASRNLYSFAAREISDLGMYQRVARGSQRRVRSPE